MTIPGIARRLVAKYGRTDAAEKAHYRAGEWDWTVHLATQTQEHRVVARAILSASRWRSVARACLRVPAPEATP